MDCSPPGSPVLGILQARILEGLAMPPSKGSSRPRDQTQVSCIAGRLFTIWATRELKVKTAQLRPTFCNPMDYIVHGILQARILEGVAFPFSRGSSQPRDSNLGLPHCRRILYQVIHKGSPGILQWVAFLQVRYFVLYLFFTPHNLCRRAYFHKGRRETSVVRNTVWPGSNSWHLLIMWPLAEHLRCSSQVSLFSTICTADKKHGLELHRSTYRCFS